MPKMIKVDKSRCMGCRQCVIECAMAHTEAATLVGALAGGNARARVYIKPGDGYGTPMQCKHCKKMRCAEACPKDAISRESDDAPVLIDYEKCVGCKQCVEACPFDAIFVLADGKTVVKCDLCIERTKRGEEPACVAGCPTGALRFE